MRAIYVLAFLLVVYANCFGQMNVKGLTPGKSSKADVDRVLGQPVGKVSETLVEYRPLELTGKIFVQYRGEAGVVERLEILCRLPNSTCNDFAKKWGLEPLFATDPEAVKSGESKLIFYYKQPHYVVTTAEEESASVFRMAFYSRELYAVTVTKALQENGVAGVDVSDPSYEEVTGVVKLRAADGSLKPVAGAAVTFCWAPDFRVCYSSGRTNGQGMFSNSVLRGTYVVVVSGPGLKWNYKQDVRIPSASALEFVAEPGDGAIPTSRDLENAVRKN